MVIEAYKKKYGSISCLRIAYFSIGHHQVEEKVILGGQKAPEKRQVKNVWLQGHKQDPAERRTNAKIVIE